MSGTWSRIVVRRSRRSTWTIIGIALCAMYLTGTISLVEGLHQTTSGIASRFHQGPIVVYDGDELEGSRMPLSDMEGLEGPAARVSLVMAELYPRGTGVTLSAYIASVDDPEGVIGLSIDDGAYIGSALAARFEELGAALVQGSMILITVGGAQHEVELTGIYGDSSILSIDWLLLNRSILEALDPTLVGHSSLLILPEGSEEDAAALEEMGYTVQTSMAVLRFFELGIYQIERSLWAVLVVTGVIVAILTYSALSIEIAFRERDVSLLRCIGAPSRLIAGVFVARGGYLALIGAGIGVAAGYLAANLLVSLAALKGMMTMIVPQASVGSVLAPIAVVVLAGVAGAAFPSLRAALSGGKR
ncbi:MAG: FtsX-like permease family protein [Candidatus Thermoplasmatota archaeon]